MLLSSSFAKMPPIQHNSRNNKDKHSLHNSFYKTIHLNKSAHLFSHQRKTYSFYPPSKPLKQEDNNLSKTQSTSFPINNELTITAPFANFYKFPQRKLFSTRLMSSKISRNTFHKSLHISKSLPDDCVKDLFWIKKLKMNNFNEKVNVRYKLLSAQNVNRKSNSTQTQRWFCKKEVKEQKKEKKIQIDTYVKRLEDVSKALIKILNKRKIFDRECLNEKKVIKTDKSGSVRIKKIGKNKIM
jgi:hypothetical protein